MNFLVRSEKSVTQNCARAPREAGGRPTPSNKQRTRRWPRPMTIGGHEVWRQRVQKEQRVLGLAEPPVPRSFYTMKSSAPPSSPRPSVYDNVYASSPRGSLLGASSPRLPPAPNPSAPRTTMPHLRHHFGYGWGNGGATSPRATGPGSSWGKQGAKHISATPHPFCAMKLPGEQRLEDSLPERVSRLVPLARDSPRAVHEAHVLSWPGHARYVDRKTTYYRPHVDSQCEARGELPPTARMLVSAGSRPFMPVFASTAQ